MHHTLADAPAFFFGLWNLLAQAYFAGVPKWRPEEIPDQTDRTIIITGGNSGVGLECAKALLQRNATVYLACRNKTSAEAVISDLQQATGKTAKFLRLDLNDLKSIKNAAQEFIKEEKQLHVLFNNAGVMFIPMEHEVNGYDAQIHTNVLGHYYFTKLLLPVLLSTAQGGIKPRIINVSSSGHYLAGSQPLDLNTFKCTSTRKKCMTEEMYIQSKFANIVMSNDFASRYGEQNLVFISVNPGNIKTKLDRHEKNPLKRFILRCLQIYPPTLGAVTQLWAGTAPEAERLNGQFCIPWARIGSARAETRDPKLQRDLREWLEEQVNSER